MHRYQDSVLLIKCDPAPEVVAVTGRIEEVTVARRTVAAAAVVIATANTTRKARTGGIF